MDSLGPVQLNQVQLCALRFHSMRYHVDLIQCSTIVNTNKYACYSIPFHYDSPKVARREESRTSESINDNALDINVASAIRT